MVGTTIQVRVSRTFFFPPLFVKTEGRVFDESLTKTPVGSATGGEAVSPTDARRYGRDSLAPISKGCKQLQDPGDGGGGHIPITHRAGTPRYSLGLSVSKGQPSTEL